MLFINHRPLLAGVCAFALFGTSLGAAPQPFIAPRAVVMKKAGDLIHRQDPPVISVRLLDQVSPDNAHVLVSLSRQRAYLMLNEETALDTPISSGKAARPTPPGKFTILEKDPNHHSNIYGNFVDSRGRIIRAGVSARIDSAPAGTHFEGAPMRWFMRLTPEGVGMHVGILPGYAASHGCVRLPEDMALKIYDKVKVGTPVEVTD